MPRDSRVYLEDMLAAAEKVARYAAGMTRAALADDPKTLDAILRNLEVIGEAAKNVPAAVRKTCPRIEWQKVAGLRDLLIHQYFGIDLDIIWDIVQNKVPRLTEDLREVQKQAGGPPPT